MGNFCPLFRLDFKPPCVYFRVMRLEIGRYIVVDDGVCHGKPVFKGTRVLVSDVVELLGAGVSIEEIVRDYYPSLNEEMIREAMRYYKGTFEKNFAGVV